MSRTDPDYAKVDALFARASSLLDSIEASTYWSELNTAPVLSASLTIPGEEPQLSEVHFNLEPEGLRFAGGECSCAAPPPCLHLACVALIAERQLTGDEERGNEEAAERAPWQKALDAVLDGGQDAYTEPVALMFSFSPGQQKLKQKAGSLYIRPVALGKKGLWVRNRVGWTSFDTFPMSRAQHEVLEAIEAQYYSALNSSYGRYGSPYGYNYGSREWMDLQQLPAFTVWPLLLQARDAGISLVGDDADQTPVDLREDPIPLMLDAAESRGRLRLYARLDDPSLPAQLTGAALLGTPAVSIAHETTNTIGLPAGIVLSRLERPLSPELLRLLKRKSPLSIPTHHREQFEQGYLPRLLTVAPLISSDRSYEPPPTPRPVLVLTATPHRDGQLLLEAAWEYGLQRFPADSDAQHVLRDAPAEKALGTQALECLGRHGVPARNEDGHPLSVRLLSRGSTVRFLGEALPTLRSLDHVRVETAPGTPSYQLSPDPAQLSITAGDSGTVDWFDLDVSVRLGEQDIPFRELFLALALDDPVLVLDDGLYVPLDGAEFTRLRELIEEARQLSDRPLDSLRISRYQVDLWEEFLALGLEAKQSAHWREIVSALSTTAALELMAAPSGLNAELRSYQELGYSWMSFLLRNRLGGILADDMGLGKTVQTLAAIAGAVEEAPNGAPFLIVAPSSVVRNWILEAAKFTPGLGAVEINETAKRRGTSLKDSVVGARIVVTTYALFRMEFAEYRAIEWSALVLDEAQSVKNHRSAGYRCARQLPAPVKFAITGTPMENNLLELWSLASLCCPGLLGSERHFTEFFRQPIERDKDAGQLAVLQRRLRPFMLRRTKELVAKELPAKQLTTTTVELSAEHRKRYQLQLTKERQKVLGLLDDVDGNRFQIFRSLAILRQLAIDVSLVDDGPSRIPSAKLETALEIIEEAVAEGHRVLVFSQFTRFLSKVRDTAESRGLSTVYLDGGTRKRGDVVENFRTGDAGVFFISLKAGGVGLNLVEADYCILLDPWWNPAVEQQAIDRTHRIGQERPVMVYRLIAADTIEEKVLALNQTKAKLFAEVLDGEAASAPGTLTADDIRGLLE